MDDLYQYLVKEKEVVSFLKTLIKEQIHFRSEVEGEIPGISIIFWDLDEKHFMPLDATLKDLTQAKEFLEESLSLRKTTEEKNKLKESAFSKLTEEERLALGLK